MGEGNEERERREGVRTRSKEDRCVAETGFEEVFLRHKSAHLNKFSHGFGSSVGTRLLQGCLELLKFSSVLLGSLSEGGQLGWNISSGLLRGKVRDSEREGEETSEKRRLQKRSVNNFKNAKSTTHSFGLSSTGSESLGEGGV